MGKSLFITELDQKIFASSPSSSVLEILDIYLYKSAGGEEDNRSREPLGRRRKLMFFCFFLHIPLRRPWTITYLSVYAYNVYIAQQ